MKTLVLRISDQLAAELEAEAKRLNVSKSEVARRRLAGPVSQFAGDSKPSLWSRMQDLVIDGDSSPGDLSSNPKHMEGYGEHRAH
ncbi:hypothetical protein [Luteolibacter sp. Populi]|uniref:hypothetical protein n=1 Tax=Luteolibacter sp. Populi TaxID=3230487 RepID=UPI0034670B04